VNGYEKEYRLGLYEKALPAGMTLPRKLVCAAECGFNWLELSVDETEERLARLEWTAAERRALAEEMFASGVPISTMCLSGHRKYPIGSEDDTVRARGMDILQKAVHLAADLGIRIIQLAGYDTYYEPSTERTRALFSENLRRCVEIAARAGVILAFETMETPFLDTVQKAMRYVEAMDSPFLQVYPDVGNLTNAAHGDAAAVRADLLCGRGHIAAVHLKESAPGIYRDLVAGEGHVDFSAAIRTAYELGVRMFTAELWCRDDGWRQNVEATGSRFAALLDRAANTGARSEAVR